jgi:hypothetical protein
VTVPANFYTHLMTIFHIVLLSTFSHDYLNELLYEKSVGGLIDGTRLALRALKDKDHCLIVVCRRDKAGDWGFEGQRPGIIL